MARLVKLLIIIRWEHVQNADLMQDADPFYRFVLLHELHHTTMMRGEKEPPALFEKANRYCCI